MYKNKIYRIAEEMAPLLKYGYQNTKKPDLWYTNICASLLTQ